MKRCVVCGSRELYLHETYLRHGARAWLLRRLRRLFVFTRCAGCWRESCRRGPWLAGERYKEPDWA